jgi:hypothetical protein
LLHSRSAEIEAEGNEDHSMAALTEASQALDRIRRLAGLLDDSTGVGEINARADALEAALNAFRLTSSLAVSLFHSVAGGTACALRLSRATEDFLTGYKRTLVERLLGFGIMSSQMTEHTSAVVI